MKRVSREEAPPIVEICIQLPRVLYEKMEKLERELGVTKEDIIARAIVKVLEEFGGGE